MAAGAFLDSDLDAQLGLSYEARPLGPVRVGLGGTWLAASGGDRWGAGIELAVRFGAGVRVYPVAGVSAGWGTGAAPDTWGGWSGGLGYDLFRRGPVEAAVEGRFHRLSSPGDAVSVGVRLAVRTRSDPSPAAPARPPLRTSASPPSPAAGVVRSALEVMGTPYLWGGTDANGFDCSGLIQYAYARHGIALPRRSQEQALAGIPVPPDTLRLEPGDILSFGEAAGSISHVGLYLGDGEFIHSTSRGVRVSRLRPDDPEGAYWWGRWRGARRMLARP